MTVAPWVFWVFVAIAIMLHLMCVAVMAHMACPTQPTLERHPVLCSQPIRWFLIWVVPVPGVVLVMTVAVCGGVAMVVVAITEEFVIEPLQARFQQWRQARAN